ncbi:hypothetical protein Elgi_36640 [Paenibacillus elgii]|uniref:hypothetical protein n=1 Tax=Paenibacillus elgii TaxID=189691 RepID=UPI002D7CC0A3|nr:hypothetical protein Elgi_36640 [Paenibacillus elgii]
MEKFIFSSIPVEVSEFSNHKEVTFLISVLGEYNANNVLIEEEEGEKYHSTIVGYPILAYLKYDKNGRPNDFGGHELRAKHNSETKKVEYYFATFPIGSVTDSWIEEREVAGYEGKRKVILIKSKLWKSRFPEYFKVFDKLWDNGGISSSWEISSSDVKKTAKGKILKAFEFIGNCLLGSSVQGAVKGAGVLEVASEDEVNYELSNALLNDIKNVDNQANISSISISTDSNQEDDKEDIDNYIDLSNNEGGSELGKEGQIKTSAVTHDDLWNKVRRAVSNANSDKYYNVSIIYPYAFEAYGYYWDRASQEDFVKFNFTVNSDDTVSITSQEDVKMKFVPVSEFESQLSELQAKLDDAEKQIAEAGKLLTDATKDKEVLETQVSELQHFKEKVEEMEKAEKERELADKKEELKTFALKDNLISEADLESDDQLAQIFTELTLDTYETSQEKIEVIKGRRAIAKFKETSTNQDLETSQVHAIKKPKTDLNNSDSDAIKVSAKDIIRGWIGK